MNNSRTQGTNERFLRAAADILLMQMRGQSATRDTLMNRILSMPIASKLSEDKLEKIVEYAVEEMGY